jgi:hypothetical protein
MDRELQPVRYGGCETRDVNEMPDQALKDEHDAKEAEERWDDPEWVEELFGLWDKRLLQTDQAQAEKLPEHRQVWWDMANAQFYGVDSRSAEEKAL